MRNILMPVTLTLLQFYHVMYSDTAWSKVLYNWVGMIEWIDDDFAAGYMTISTNNFGLWYVLSIITLYK